MIPTGISLEQTILGHALNEESCFSIFVADCHWNDFVVPNHKTIAFCLSEMGRLGIKIPDEDSFQLVINNYKGDRDYGGVEYIRLLKNSYVEKTDNYSHFIENLKLQAVKWRVGNIKVKDLVRVSNDPTADYQKIRAIIEEIRDDIDSASPVAHALDSLSGVEVDYLATLAERSSGEFYTTGFPDLDEHLVDGFKPKQISVLSGFTGMAKSTVAVSMCHRIAVAGIETALFSLESTKSSFIDRLVSTISQIPLLNLKKDTRNLTDSDYARINDALVTLKHLPLLINDQASISIDNMYSQLQAAKRRGHNLKVVFIDLFGKLEDVDTGENLASKIQRECKRMRVLAKELDMHFVLVVQIGRQGYGKQKLGKIKRPTLVDIKNANAYAEEADLVLLLHRNKYYLPQLEDDILEVDIAKQRDGEANIRVMFELFPETGTIMSTTKMPHDYQDSQ